MQHVAGFSKVPICKERTTFGKKCVHTIVGGTLECYQACQQLTSLTDDDTNADARSSNNAMEMEAASESARRS